MRKSSIIWTLNWNSLKKNLVHTVVLLTWVPALKEVLRQHLVERLTPAETGGNHLFPLSNPLISNHPKLPVDLK